LSKSSGKRGGAGEEECGVNGGEALGYLLDHVEGGVVAADVDGRQVLSGQDEADDLSGHALDLLTRAGAVYGGDSCHGDRAAVRAVQFDGFPVGQTLGSVLESLPAARGGEGEPDVGKQGPAGLVQVVGMLVVRQQNHVYGAEIGGDPAGGGGLGEESAVGTGVVARGVEGRVGEEAQTAVLEEGGGATEDPDREGMGGCGKRRHVEPHG
jgi:hypothetical protein